MIRAADDRQEQNVFSSILGKTAQVEEVSPFSINQNLNYYFTLNENHIFAFEAQHLIKNEDPFYNAVLENDPTGDDVFDSTAMALGINTLQSEYQL